jgi:hypothetical protein
MSIIWSNLRTFTLQAGWSAMLVEFTKVDMVDGQPKINRVWVNPTHVVSVIQDNLKYYELKETLIKAGVHEQLNISEMKLFDGSSTNSILILGAPSTIREKLSKNKKQVLRG